MTKDYIICFAGGPLDGTAEEREYCGTHVIHHAKKEPQRLGEPRAPWEKHVYRHDELFSLADGRHVLIARYKGKQ